MADAPDLGPKRVVRSKQIASPASVVKFVQISEPNVRRTWIFTTFDFDLGPVETDTEAVLCGGAVLVFDEPIRRIGSGGISVETTYKKCRMRGGKLELMDDRDRSVDSLSLNQLCLDQEAQVVVR